MNDVIVNAYLNNGDSLAVGVVNCATYSEVTSIVASRKFPSWFDGWEIVWGLSR